MRATSASGSLHVDTAAWKLIVNFNTFDVDESFGELDDPQECFEKVRAWLHERSVPSRILDGHSSWNGGSRWNLTMDGWKTHSLGQRS